jgi:hypothetical protein
MNKYIAGNTLLSVLFFVIALALIGKPLMNFYDSWKNQKAIAETNARLETINLAIRNYVTANGRYPCPAQMTASFDTPAFGVEVADECETGTGTLTTRSQGNHGLFVRAGAVPVRTLGLPDISIFDGYGNRYIYTVTEAFAKASPDLDKAVAAVMLVDSNNNIATRDEGNIIFAVISVGDDHMGAYGRDGNLMSPCDASALSGENCDMDATLRNTVKKASAEGTQKFTQNIRYKTGNPCVNSFAAPPQKMAYLLDTSQSMDTKVSCPPNYSGPCNRMHSAQWAMRRAIASRNVQIEEDPDATTDFTGFIGPEADSLLHADIHIDKDTNIENKLSGMCPSGKTPLGEHIAALAERIGPGKSVEQPNAIMVLSDGYSNQGRDPIDVASEIGQKYGGKLIVHIIDMGYNPDLAEVSQLTSAPDAKPGEGGQYFQASDPQKILDWLLKLSGSCESMEIPEPPDQRHC